MPIITKTKAPWQKLIQDVITEPEVLLTALGLRDFREVLVHSPFKFRVPRRWLDCIKPGDPNDPVLLQILPRPQEQVALPGFTHDPLQEQEAIPVAGVLHKFPNRVLLTLTGSCVLHCRYCFRRNFPYTDNTPSKQLGPILEYLKNHPEITEVILSGGDPLSLSDDYLAFVLKALEDIPSIRYLRFHTRLLSIIPERVTDELIRLLTDGRFTTTVVLHMNHPQEILPELKPAIARLRQEAGVQVLLQSVLLKDINDSVDTLVDLYEALYRCGVLPYYLHLLDKVSGAHHFEVTQTEAKILYQGLLKRLPGFLVPRFVQEIPKLPHKQPLFFE